MTLATQWTGDSFAPLKRYAKECDARFVIGEIYLVEVRETRSEASHRSYFASINEAWLSLPDAEAERFPTAEHLRKFALIKSGFSDERQIVCSSRAEAVRLAAFVRPMDTYAIVAVRMGVVTVYTAKSQSMRAMGKADFQRSQQAVREFIAGLLGVKADELPSEGAA